MVAPVDLCHRSTSEMRVSWPEYRSRAHAGNAWDATVILSNTDSRSRTRSLVHYRRSHQSEETHMADDPIVQQRPVAYIRCPGCGAVTDAYRAACSGCGRCPGCGIRRGECPVECRTCSLPYCHCCGVCVGCRTSRMDGVAPDCDCGHPQDDTRLQQLIESQGI